MSEETLTVVVTALLRDRGRLELDDGAWSAHVQPDSPAIVPYTWPADAHPDFVTAAIWELRNSQVHADNEFANTVTRWLLANSWSIDPRWLVAGRDPTGSQVDSLEGALRRQLEAESEA